MSIAKSLQIFVLLLILTYTSGQDNGNTPRNPDSYGFSSGFNPSMAIIMVVIVSAFFVMGFFSIYIRQCTGDRSVSPGGNGVAGRSRRGMKGLDRVVMNTFPTFVYSAVKELKIGKGTLECAVCLNEFEEVETLRLLPKCDHVFHSECIDVWLASHVTCPVCRANLVPEDESSSSSQQTVVESSDHHSQAGNQVSPHTEGPNNQFPVHVVEDEKSIFSSTASLQGKFPRSHTTGHSIVQPGLGGEDHERFTLRLPEDIRNQIVNGKLLIRSNSCLSFPASGYEAGGGGSRRGYRSGSMKEGSSRGKTNRFWRWDTNANSSEGSSRSVKFLTSVKSLKTSMECLSVKVDGDPKPALRRPPV